MWFTAETADTASWLLIKCTVKQQRIENELQSAYDLKVELTFAISMLYPIFHPRKPGHFGATTDFQLICQLSPNEVISATICTVELPGNQNNESVRSATVHCTGAIHVSLRSAGLLVYQICNINNNCLISSGQTQWLVTSRLQWFIKLPRQNPAAQGDRSKVDYSEFSDLS